MPATAAPPFTSPRPAVDFSDRCACLEGGDEGDRCQLRPNHPGACSFMRSNSSIARDLRDVLERLLDKLEVMNGAHAVNVTEGHEECFPEIIEAHLMVAKYDGLA